MVYRYVSGSGSVFIDQTMMMLNYQPKVTYNQYRTVLLDQTDTLFTVLGTDGTESEDISDIYVLNIVGGKI